LIFVDTGAFLAKYLRSDQHHAESLAVWERIERNKERVSTSNMVISELATLMARRSTYSFAAETIRNLYDSDIFDILRPDREDERLALRFFEKYADQEVSFTDCLSFALMRAHSIRQAFAFDRHFDLPGFTRIPLVS
jgi:predicted nucleic acid-binding protein